MSSPSIAGSRGFFAGVMLSVTVTIGALVSWPWVRPHLPAIQARAVQPVRDGPSPFDEGFIEHTRGAVFEVATGASRGSGFFANVPGLGVVGITNLHVVDKALAFLPAGGYEQRREVNLLTGSGQLVEASVRVVLREFDLAILHVKSLPEGVAALDIAQRPAGVGEAVVAWGSPRALGVVALDGYVTSVGDNTSKDILDGGKVQVVRVAISTAPGSSGGPLLDVEGRVLGVVVASNVSTAGVSLGRTIAIASAAFARHLPKIRRESAENAGGKPEGPRKGSDAATRATDCARASAATQRGKRG